MHVFFDIKPINKTKTNASGQLFQMQLYFCSNTKTYNTFHRKSLRVFC
jgi:hypothetical protein